MFTLYRVAFAPPWKLYRTGLQFTHKNSWGKEEGDGKFNCLFPGPSFGPLWPIRSPYYYFHKSCRRAYWMSVSQEPTIASITSWINFHLTQLKNLLLSGHNAEISSSRQWIYVTHSCCNKIGKGIESDTLRIACHSALVACHWNKNLARLATDSQQKGVVFGRV